MDTSSEASAPTAMRFSTAISAGDWILASGVACTAGANVGGWSRRVLRSVALL